MSKINRLDTFKTKDRMFLFTAGLAHGPFKRTRGRMFLMNHIRLAQRADLSMKKCAELY